VGSDIDAAVVEADVRMNAIVSSMSEGGQVGARGDIGDEVPLQAVADAVAQVPAGALIVSVHPPDVANWRERRPTEEALERFGLPVTEVVIDRDRRVLSVSAD
jgi:hypothetical protein